MITPRTPILGTGGTERTPFIDETGDIVFLGQPLATHTITLRITGRRKGEPLLCTDDFDEDDE